MFECMYRRGDERKVVICDHKPWGLELLWEEEEGWKLEGCTQLKPKSRSVSSIVYDEWDNRPYGETVNVLNDTASGLEKLRKSAKVAISGTVFGGNMRFGDDHKVIIETMTPMEAEAYLQFLEAERRRHTFEKVQAESRAKYYYALARFYGSTSQRSRAMVRTLRRLACWPRRYGRGL